MWDILYRSVEGFVRRVPENCMFTQESEVVHGPNIRLSTAERARENYLTQMNVVGQYGPSVIEYLFVLKRIPLFLTSDKALESRR
jgi:hypothetical protein